MASALLFLALIGAGLILIWPALNNRPGGSITATNNFDQLVVVAMENKNLYDVYQNGAAPYLNSLNKGAATHWASITNPSQPNYIAVLGGSTFGVTGDGNHPNLNHPTLVDIIENSGHTWKAFAEDASGTGCGLRPPRGEDHFSFLSYTTITGNQARCANLLPGSSNEVISAFNAGTGFIWLTPNDCNNMHSCSVSTGDNYLKSWVPSLLNAMAGKKAAIIIWWDEAYTNPPYIPLFIAGPAAKDAFVSSNQYNHYSLLKLVEDVWGGGNLGQGDVNAPSPLEFFLAGGPDFSISANPSSVSFAAGGSGTSTVTVTPSGGFTGTVDLTASSSPAGVTTTCNPSSIPGGSGTSTCTMTGSSPGSYTVTITGTSGSLVHSTPIAVTITTPVTPDFSLSASPSSVSFPVGGSAPTTIAVQPFNGFTGNIDLTATSNPSGVSTSCVPSSITESQTSTCTLSSSAVGSYTVTVTGTSGGLSHTTSIAATVTPAGPTARFTHSPVLPKVNELITFDASSSSDTDPSATLQARWDWESDGVWDTAYSSSLTAQHAYAVSGPRAVTLQIQDSHGLTSTAAAGVTVFDENNGGIGAPPGYGLTDPSRLQAHAPIYINVNTAFTAANGVRRGTGTAADPYVISDWLIDGSLYPGSQAMIHVESTDAYVTIENNKIVNLANSNHWEAIQLGHWPATISTQHVTIRHNHVENARHAYGIAVREGSRDVRVEANFVQTDATYDLLYGIMTDRGVHDVTIIGNYVNAYTSGTFHTSGIHLSDTYVDEASRASGVVAIQNTVVNATAAAIESLSSTGTVIVRNLVYTDNPGAASVGPGYPRGIDTAYHSDGTIVAGNLIHTFASGILVGADDDLISSNTIFGVDYGIFVPDNGSMPGVSVFGGKIYNTSMWDVSRGAVRLPARFGGTVVDLGPGLRSSDLSSVLFSTERDASRIAVSWSGAAMNLSATVDGTVLYDTAVAAESQTLQAAWTGAISKFNVTGFSSKRVAFHLESGGGVAFDGSGFAGNTLYHVTRTNPSGTSEILSVQSSASGGLSFTVPAAEPSDYVVTTEATAPGPAPGGPGLPTLPGLPDLPETLKSMPFLLALLGLLPLLLSVILVRRRRRRRRARRSGRTGPTRGSASRRVATAPRGRTATNRPVPRREQWDAGDPGDDRDTRLY